MRNLILSLVILFISLAHAQTVLGPSANRPARLVKTAILDSSLVDCIYSYSVYDPKRDETRESFQILEIGKNFSHFSAYGEYQIDSILKNQYNNKITVQGYFRLSGKYKNNGGMTWKELIKNKRDNKINIYADVLIDHYIYIDSINDLKWKLYPNESNILGYKCHKATTTFRGRNWTVWYCNEIPQNNGPWIFGNLPGLILKAEDDKGEHKFEAITIRNGRRQFGYKIKKHGQTTRKKFYEALAEFKNHPETMIDGTVRHSDNTPLKKFQPLFFNPIELE